MPQDPLSGGVQAAAVPTWIVVPCYNEEHRLDGQAFEDHLRDRPEVGFIFVNDGSRDATLTVLQALGERCPHHVQVIDQQPNQGKAEAVRTGMRRGLANGCSFVGYFDADLATPLDAIEDLLRVMRDERGIDIVMGARVAMLGRAIRRSSFRHYAGRAFATAASLALSLPVYDTQCGAKLFRANDVTRDLVARPFRSRWIFDVELLARYLVATGSPAGISELPLRQWTDKGDSRLRAIDALRAMGEIAQIGREYRTQSKQRRSSR